MTLPIEFTAAWSLFRNLEDAADDGLDLPLRDIDEFLDAALDEIGTEGLSSGWALVAARLRQVIQDHARTVGCSCGGREWLAAEQLRNVEHEQQGGIAMADLGTASQRPWSRRSP